MALHIINFVRDDVQTGPTVDSQQWDVPKELIPHIDRIVAMVAKGQNAYVENVFQIDTNNEEF